MTLPKSVALIALTAMLAGCAGTAMVTRNALQFGPSPFDTVKVPVLIGVYR